MTVMPAFGLLAPRWPSASPPEPTRPTCGAPTSPPTSRPRPTERARASCPTCTRNAPPKVASLRHEQSPSTRSACCRSCDCYHRGAPRPIGTAPSHRIVIVGGDAGGLELAARLGDQFGSPRCGADHADRRRRARISGTAPARDRCRHGQLAGMRSTTSPNRTARLPLQQWRR